MWLSFLATNKLCLKKNTIIKMHIEKDTTPKSFALLNLNFHFAEVTIFTNIFDIFFRFSYEFII